MTSSPHTPDPVASSTTPEAPERGAVLGWLLTPVPLHRVAVMRIIAYLFIWVDVWLTTSWIALKADAPQEFYVPLRIAELLHLPVPTATYVVTLKWVMLVAALVAATGWRPRITGSVVAICYLLWMFVGMSYGKVDHDRFAFLVLLVVLPTVGGARWGDTRRSEKAGWALQAVFIAVMLTYFLSAIAKVRYGGIDWPTGATLTRAIIRRGTPLSDWMVNVPWLLMVSQFIIIGLEAISPVMLMCRTVKARVLLVGFLLAFHLAVFGAVTIIFLPHVIAILSILPWERLLRSERAAARDRDPEPDPVSSDP